MMRAPKTDPKTDPKNPRRIAQILDMLTGLQQLFPSSFGSVESLANMSVMWSRILEPWSADQIQDAMPELLRKRRVRGQVQPAEVDEWLTKHTSTGSESGKKPRWADDYEARKARYRSMYTDKQLIQMNRAMRPFDTMDPALEVAIAEADARRLDNPDETLPAEMVSDLIATFRETVLKKSRKTLAKSTPRSAPPAVS